MAISLQNPHSFYIDGRWRDADADAQAHDVPDAADGSTVATIRLATTSDVDAAVSAAARAFPGWAATPVEERIAAVERIVAIYERRVEDIAQAITAEMGAPLDSLSRPVQAPIGLWHFGSALAAAREFAFDRMLNGTTRILREPIGVVAMITPWNWPMNQVIIKVAPALLAGCTMVLKPSEDSPLSAHLLAEIVDEAGLPAGVFNMVHGRGRDIGEHLSSHPLVDMVSLTGSGAAGIAVTKAAADSIKRVSLELGGKSPNIILDGENFADVVARGVRQMMFNSGQSCNAPSRMLVPASRLGEAELIAATTAETILVGDPRDSSTEVGPIANARQYARVQKLIEQGLAEGAKAIAGGPGLPAGLASGHYCRPTVFSEVSSDMTIAKEEIFGPVLCLIPYKDEEDAIRIANDTVYGLSAYVNGGDADSRARIAGRIRAGMVHLQGAQLDMAAPFGGYKQSGNGREWGAWGLEDFLETKAVMGVA